MKEIKVPDIGDVDKVDVIEVLVQVGDAVEVDAPLISLESDKASMDIPSPEAGTVREIKVSAGDSVSQGDVILTLEPADAAGGEDGEKKEDTKKQDTDEADEAGEAGEAEKKAEPESDSKGKSESKKSTDAKPQQRAQTSSKGDHQGFINAYASPSVRRFARELGVDLSKVEGSARQGRIVKSDVQGFVKNALAVGTGEGTGGSAIPPMPEIDFSKFGDVETVTMSRIQKVSSKNLHRSWLNVPHVTQHEDADITAMDAFRKEQKAEAEKHGVKLTPVAFLIKAAVAALQQHPRLNASLAPSGDAVILKKYFHIGIAVDTDDGLVVPVVRNADKKGLYELAEELGDLSSRARERKLKMDELQGASFTITSLGGIGGTAFTPIVNAPEVAILGVSRASMKPVWIENEFVPRLILPLSLSYDHRVVDGALAARFVTTLSWVLGDLRRMLL